jgi:3-phosphoshikimate 1-carboxyvinyltransferase
VIEIKPRNIARQTVIVPGSKSYTHRALIVAALANGSSIIRNPLDSEDTRLTRAALQQMGIAIELEDTAIGIRGGNGRLMKTSRGIDLRNSGTSMRLLTAVAALGEGEYVLTGTPRMQERPIQDLLDGLEQIGVAARSVNGNGCPPVSISGGRPGGGRVEINCQISSQFLSGLLLIAPCTAEGLEIIVTHGPVSRPYIDLTLAVMADFGVEVEREGYRYFKVPGNRAYQGRDYQVESDASQAGYFWAAGAITGADIKVEGITRNSLQGDVGLVDVFQRMGCQVREDDDGISVCGQSLNAIDVDMAHMPDLVPTLAVVAAFARGTTVIRNVAHLRAKESDRLGGVANELRKMGIDAQCTEDGLTVTGGTPHGDSIDTYDDHRMAMSFAVAGLRVPGMRIRDERCVEKSFPRFWEVFQGMA